MINPADGRLGLTWTAPATMYGTLTNYLVEYTPAGGNTTAVLTNSTGASFSITGLTNGVSYSVKVAAVTYTRGDYVTGVGVPAVTSLSPNQVSGLQLWYDIADSSTLFNAISGGSTPGADQAVKRIEDKSGNARHATSWNQGMSAIRKVSRLNSKDTLMSGSMSVGANNGMEVFNITNGSDLSFLHQAQSTVFCLFKGVNPAYPTSTILSSMSYNYSYLSAGFWLMTQKTYADKWSSLNANWIRMFARFASVSNFEMRYDGQPGVNSYTFGTWTNLVLSNNMTASVIGDRSNWIIGGSNVSLNESGAQTTGWTPESRSYRLFGSQENVGAAAQSAFDGELAELFIYNSQLNSETIAALRTYLLLKWGVA